MPIARRNCLKLLGSALLLPRTAHAENPPAAPPPFRGMDLYGTRQVTLQQVEAKFGRQVREMAGLDWQQQTQKFAALMLEVVRGVKEMGRFAYVGVSPIRYYEPPGIYVTVDVVDEADRATRMAFLPAPQETLDEPGNLFQRWKAYEERGFRLIAAGKLPPANPGAVPAFHSLFGFEHPELAPFLAEFDAGARAHEELLYRILRHEKRSELRGYAAYLLAHTPNGQRVVEACAAAIRDPASFARNNAMRVLAHVVRHHRQLTVPLDPILAAIRFPETTDRNKSLYVLDGLADRLELRPRIRREAGSALLEALRLLQPNNHDPALSVLRKLGGRDIAPRDYTAWEKWLHG